jgi:hypothetical protein
MEMKMLDGRSKNTDNKPQNSIQTSIHNTKHANSEDNMLMAA